MASCLDSKSGGEAGKQTTSQRPLPDHCWAQAAPQRAPNPPEPSALFPFPPAFRSPLPGTCLAPILAWPASNHRPPTTARPPAVASPACFSLAENDAIFPFPLFSSGEFPFLISLCPFILIHLFLAYNLFISWTSTLGSCFRSCYFLIPFYRTCRRDTDDGPHTRHHVGGSK